MYEYNANIIRVYDGDTVWADLDLGFGLWILFIIYVLRVFQ